MKQFKEYLFSKGYKVDTVRGYSNTLGMYVTWCSENGINPKKATLDELYDFQGYNRLKGDGVGYIRSKNKAIELYFNFIGRKVNPAMLLKLEKREIKLPKHLLDEDAMITLYLGYIANNIVKKRNKILLGLTIFQALKRIEIDLLEVSDIDFKSGCVHVPQTTRTNKRKLQLKQHQLQDLKEYVFEIRPQLLKESNKNTNKLFFSQGSGERLNNVVSIILKELKANFSFFDSLMQLQQSRISIWVKEYGLRETQYLCGFRFVSSVERYVTKDTEALRNKLRIVHPMEQLGISS